VDLTTLQDAYDLKRARNAKREIRAHHHYEKRKSMKLKPCALVSDADPAAQGLLCCLLTTNGYEAVKVEYGLRDLAEAVARHQPDLLLLDDLALCAPIRLQGIRIPIIILSRSKETYAIVRALDEGADDYVKKPFGNEELLARLRAHLRRTQQTATQVEADEQELVDSEDGYIRLHVAKRRVFIGEREVRFTPIEFELLRLLMMHAEKVLTHRTLLRRIWGPAYGEEAVYLRVYVRQLRRKVEPDPANPRYIVTESGVGYMFCGSKGRRVFPPGSHAAFGELARGKRKGTHEQ
jgi:two-component system KDP operon response regulator KdpE